MTLRDEFEAFIRTRKLCTKYGAKLDFLPDGQYRDIRVRGHYSTYQAAHAAQQKRVEELEAALRGLMQACEQSFDWQYDPQFTATFSEAEQALSATAPQHDWRQIGEAEYECTICGADSEGNASECATAREGER
jgi:hypothetical protein